jgi:hypothetical protein
LRRDEQWAHELIEECAAFPNGEFDDYVDSTTQALMRYRQGNFVQLPTDDWQDEEESPRIQGILRLSRCFKADKACWQARAFLVRLRQTLMEICDVQV